MEDLGGRVAVVTGASRGIGRELARGLAEAGATVSGWSRDALRCTDALGIDAHVVACDIRHHDQVDAAMAQTVADLGRVDILVANAGRRSELISPLDVQPDDVEDIIRTNLLGTFWTMRAAARQMVSQGGGGRIIAISSVRAVRGAPLGAAYVASKCGIEGIVRSMAVGLACHRIQVNAVRPGWAATGMTAELRADPAASARFLEQVPAGRFAAPEDLLGVVSYLASPAASFHTGDVLTVDGGLTAGSPVDGTTMFDPIDHPVG